MNDHLSSSTIADRIKRLAICGRTARYADLLAAGRVYLLRMSPYIAVSSYLTPFTLTPHRFIHLFGQDFTLADK